METIPPIGYSRKRDDSHYDGGQVSAAKRSRVIGLATASAESARGEGHGESLMESSARAGAYRSNTPRTGGDPYGINHSFDRVVIDPNWPKPVSSNVSIGTEKPPTPASLLAPRGRPTAEGVAKNRGGRNPSHNLPGNPYTTHTIIPLLKPGEPVSYAKGIPLFLGFPNLLHMATLSNNRHSPDVHTVRDLAEAMTKNVYSSKPGSHSALVAAFFKSLSDFNYGGVNRSLGDTILGLVTQGRTEVFDLWPAADIGDTVGFAVVLQNHKQTDVVQQTIRRGVSNHARVVSRFYAGITADQEYTQHIADSEADFKKLFSDGADGKFRVVVAALTASQFRVYRARNPFAPAHFVRAGDMTLHPLNSPPIASADSSYPPLVFENSSTKTYDLETNHYDLASISRDMVSA